MFKVKKKVLVILFVMFLFIIPICFAPPITTVDSSANLDAINKMIQTANRDMAENINRNVDTNFVQLDSRMKDTQIAMFRKGIIALAGVMCVMLFGYAYINNRIQKKYELNFYEKMMDAKIEKISLTASMAVTSLYTSVTKPQYEKKFDATTDYFKELAESQHVNDLDAEIKQLKQKLAKYDPKMRKELHLYSSVKDDNKVKDMPESIPSGDKTVSRLRIGLIIFGIIAVLVVVYYLFFSTVKLNVGGI
jgi:hypothetical protein